MMNSLGKSQCSRGRFKEALKLHKDAIEEMRIILSPNHEDIFRAMTNLEVVHQMYFQWRLVKELHIEAVKGLTKALGRTNNDTLTTMKNFAMTNLKIGDDSLHDVRDTINEVMEQRSKKLGKDNGQTLWFKLCLARVKSALSSEKEVEIDMRALIEIATGNYGANHFAILYGRTRLTSVLVRQQRYSEAEEILLDVIEPSRYKAGARKEGDHLDRLLAMWKTMECYHLQGKVEEATELCTEVLDSLRRMGGEKHALATMAKEKLSELGEQPLALPAPPPYSSSNPGV